MVQQNIHGGDIYRNQVSLDFSVNINPFGMPQRVREALEAAVAWCERIRISGRRHCGMPSPGQKGLRLRILCAETVRQNCFLPF